MRPIDADALKKEIKRLLGLAHDREAQTFGNDIPDTIRVRYQTQYNERSTFCNLIDNAPTVDIKAFANITFDKDELEQIVRDKVIEPIKNGELVVKEERPQGEWIPVSERLPEIATRCLVQLSDRHITIGEYFSIEKWCLIETSYAIAFSKEVVVAWMPLPEPYKEGSER